MIVQLYPTRSAKARALEAMPGPAAKKLGLGDLAEKAFHPIAVALRLPCLDKDTKQLKADSPCGKRRAQWNEFGKKIGIGGKS